MMRFTPPPVALPAELAWLLGAAFGPAPPAAAGDPARVANLAEHFDLGPRIVARHGARRIEEILGPAAADLVRAHRRAAVIGLVGDRTALAIASLAASHRLDLVFLKGYAMQRLAPGPPGGRPYADLDLLLSRSQATELRELLVADGWTAAAEEGNPQHLPPVQDPKGIPVDIHFRLRGVRVGAERWATAPELLSADLCQPIASAPGTWIPRPPLMAAHLVAHALEQHGHRPGTYPLLRAVADVIDLAAVAGDGELEAECRKLVADELDPADLAALFALGRVLDEGRLPGASAEGNAEILLRHIVAGALDSGYRRGLAIDHTAGRLRQARRDGELMRYISRKLEVPAGSVDATADGQGPDRWRAPRPIQLAARFTAAAAARLRRLFHR